MDCSALVTFLLTASTSFLEITKVPILLCRLSLSLKNLNNVMLLELMTIRNLNNRCLIWRLVKNSPNRQNKSVANYYAYMVLQARAIIYLLELFILSWLVHMKNPIMQNRSSTLYVGMLSCSPSYSYLMILCVIGKAQDLIQTWSQFQFFHQHYNRMLYIYQAHEIPASGHHRQDKTLQKLHLNAYWVGMASNVSEYCQKCTTCQKAKLPSPSKASLVSLPVGRQWEMLAVDVLEVPLSIGGRSFSQAEGLLSRNVTVDMH